MKPIGNKFVPVINDFKNEMPTIIQKYLDGKSFIFQTIILRLILEKHQMLTDPEKPTRAITKKDYLLKDAKDLASRLMNCSDFLSPIRCFELFYEYGVIEAGTFEKVFKATTNEKHCHFLLLLKEDFLTRSNHRSPWSSACGNVFDNKFYGIDSDDRFIITRSTNRLLGPDGKTVHILKERFDREKGWLSLSKDYNFGCYEKSIPLAIKIQFQMNKFKNKEISHNVNGTMKTGRVLEGNFIINMIENHL